MSEWCPFELLGQPETNGFLIICDHASNAVPPGINLGIDARLMANHIAYDIGVAAIARELAEIGDYAAFLARQSRLIVDLNRNDSDPDVIPAISDGIIISGNANDVIHPNDRLSRFHHPYHDALERLLLEHRPQLILSLHSFTPALKSKQDELRPWDVGILYNEFSEGAEVAIEFLEEQGLKVGDQLPYSGKQLNATMNRHAEANGIAYVGVELRQDLIEYGDGQAKFAQILDDMCQHVAETLALSTYN